MAVSRPGLEALRPGAGSLRLVAARWMLSILAALPGIAAANAALSESVGTKPWFTEAPHPLPLPQFFGVLDEAGAVLPILFLGALVAWIFHQMLTAAAIEILDPRRTPGRVRLWRTLVDSGWRHLLIYLRVSLLALVCLVVGARGVTAVFGRLADRGVVEGWTGQTLIYTLPVVQVLVLLAWAGIVGAFAWWSRVILTQGGRRYVRRMLTVVPRLMWRSPLLGFLLHWFLATASVLIAVVALFSWRQTPGVAHSVAIGWLIAWLVLLLVQAAVWQYRLRLLSLTWSLARFDDLRGKPDSSWGLFRRLKQRLKRRRVSPVA
jgi:hypothetical protein